MGYRVLEDYLRQGQQAAAALGSVWAGGLGAGADSFQTLSERLLRDGLLWLEQIARLWASVDPPGRGSGAAPAPQDGAAGSGFRAEIDSRAPVEVALELRAGAGGRPLGVHDLRSPDPEQPALAGIDLAEAAGTWCVRIRVQDGQPPGRYSGVVFDRRDGSIQGTLSACVGPAGGTR